MEPSDDRADRLPSATPPSLTCFVYSRYRYVTLAFDAPGGRGQPQAFTVHRAEAEKLVAVLQKALGLPIDESFEITPISFVEGVAAGGPPEKAQLAEFMKGE